MRLKQPGAGGTRSSQTDTFWRR